ncbi:uncharacterized protein LOC128220342 [Mya arenaria]|uniref:uncharacterized protein LOC128220342 n=1 Tax=Mya arenaria TaxID=6604 RepID=UPI0022E88E86|nr:uncharacterized protein LOC128220342 [Mya arenaria]
MTVGWVTLNIGEQALVYNHEGQARIEDGPQRMFLLRERIFMLTRYSANQNEYLVIKHRDGRMEHVQGPCAMFLNTIAYHSMKTEDMISLDANEALVVYKKEEKSNEVKRYIKYGPTMFMPLANEWLHSFCWHGTDPSNKTRLIPNQKRFERLQIIPDQFYYNVDEVRTADDALIRVKLMIFYELTDIELMLQTTRDPIADFINCVCADTMAFAAKHSYIEFIENSSELNILSSFPQLTGRAKSIGYSISKVVFRGYFAHEKLQKLHDGAIEVRTKLKICYETEEQEQNMTDLKLKNEKDRIDLEQKIEFEVLAHKLELERSAAEHQLEMEMKEEEMNCSKWLTDSRDILQAKMFRDKQQLEFYNDLHSLSVDLNMYTKTLSGKPERVTRILAAGKAANLHLHHS